MWKHRDGHVFFAFVGRLELIDKILEAITIREGVRENSSWQSISILKAMD
jgi:hypothetical protein